MAGQVILGAMLLAGTSFAAPESKQEHPRPALFQELGREGTPMAFAEGGWFLSKDRGVVMMHVVDFDRTDCPAMPTVTNPAEVLVWRYYVGLYFRASLG